MNIVLANWENIILILIVVGVLLFLYKLGKKQMVAQILLGLVVRAEKALGSKTGELKYALVVNWLYEKLPPIVRFLFTRNEIDKMIEDGVYTLTKYLEQGISLAGYDDELYIHQLQDGSGELQEDSHPPEKTT